MQSVIKGILFIVLLGLFTVAVAHEMPREGKSLLGTGLSGFEILFLVFIALSVLWAIWIVDRMSSKLKKKIISSAIAIVTAGGANYYVEETVKETVKETVIFYTEADSSSRKEMQKAIIDSQDTIKALLAALPDTSVSKSRRDSLWARMDSLNICIDKHFASTRRRLIRIEEKLER